MTIQGLIHLLRMVFTSLRNWGILELGTRNCNRVVSSPYLGLLPAPLGFLSVGFLFIGGKDRNIFKKGVQKLD